MDDPKAFGFDHNKMINGERVTKIDSIYDTIDRQ